jgi:hypothetical protein
MEVAKTHLGTKELHKRHSVMVEGGKYPRSKVMDQHIIDRYLMQGKLTLKQFIIGEMLLAQAAKAGVWPKGANLTGTSMSSKPNYVPYGIVPLGRSLNIIKDRYGEGHVYVVRKVIIDNKDVSRSQRFMQWLLDSLDWLDINRGRKDPITTLQAALARPLPNAARTA